MSAPDDDPRFTVAPPKPCCRCADRGIDKSEGFERYSFGVYAGRYCDPCWASSGYRDVDDPTARFDPADAGERMEPDDP
jgi:hypothetical protein